MRQSLPQKLAQVRNQPVRCVLRHRMRLGSIIMCAAFEHLTTSKAGKERLVERILSKGRGLSRRTVHKSNGLASVREERTAYQVIRHPAIAAQSAGTRCFDNVAFRHVSARIE